MTTSQFAHRALVDHVTSPIQTGSHVHPGRDRRRTGLVPYTTYRTTVQEPLQGVAVHRRQFEGGSLYERKRPLQVSPASSAVLL